MVKINGPSGTVLDVPAREARGLVRDGFAKYESDADRKEGDVLPRRAQGQSESAQFAAGGRVQHVQQTPAKPAEPKPEPSKVDLPEDDEPSARATRQELADYAVEKGIVNDADDLQGKTKDEIRELIDGSN